MILFVTTDRDIRSISMPSKEYGLVQSGILQAHSVTSEYEDGFVYWTEKGKEKAGIFKSLVDGSARQYVISVGVETVEDLALDWIGRHIYFADSSRKHIVACDVHGTLCTVVLSGELDKPRAVAVYPEVRMLFWSDWGSRPHIGSAGMDGSKRKDIITTDIIWPNGLAVDETIQRIYWSDAKLNRIESSRTDGSNRIILPVTVNHPYAIDIFENMVYWCDPVDHEVQSCDKFTGKNHKVLMKEASLTPTGIHIHHPSKQRHSSNPCWNAFCSHICLLSPSWQGFQCACPIGLKLNSDNRTCDSNSVQEPSIIIASYMDLFQVTHHQIGKDSIVHLPTRSLENVGALAFNPLGHSIIYSDLSRKMILSMHLETQRETVLFENTELVEGLDVDPYTENIYWTEVAQGTLIIGHQNHDGTRERIVLARDLHSPKGIALAPELGLMFVVEGRISHVISVRHMDGTSRHELVQVYGSVSAMAYDRKHLYFSDSQRGTIERVTVNGTERTTLRAHLGSPVAMDVSNDAVFWLTQYSSRVEWLYKQEPKTTRSFVVDTEQDPSTQYRILSVVDSFDYADEHVCLGHTGGCSDICAPTPNGAKCMCPPGKELAVDGHICHPISCPNTTSTSDFFKCQSSVCIPSKNRCDGFPDCPMGDDEVNCRNDSTTIEKSVCTSLQFQCRSGGCIAKAFYCDGDYDCFDQSDEPASCPPHQCYSDEVNCPNQRTCIPRSVLCDGQADCAGGWDEANCTQAAPTCLPHQFNCKHGRLCIPLSWVCDKDPDCDDGEDEKNCNGNTNTSLPLCPPFYIRCPPQNDCVPRRALCNGVFDCDRRTDQELCSKINEPTEVPEKDDVECSSRQFNCYMGSNECVSLSSRCDCKFDSLLARMKKVVSRAVRICSDVLENCASST